MNSWKESFIRLEHNTKRYKGRKEDLDTIFTVLKDKEELETWKEVAEDKEKEFNIIHEECVRLTEIKNKQDKILKIIKEKTVDVSCLLESRDVGTYNASIFPVCSRFLTQEEYDLLKGYFK